MRRAVALGLGLTLSGCSVQAYRPWVKIARQATGDGLSPDTPAHFDPMPRDPMMFIRSEWAWLELRGYVRIDEQQVKTILVPGRRGSLFLHAWPVRDAVGQERIIYFEETALVGPPIAGRMQP